MARTANPNKIETKPVTASLTLVQIEAIDQHIWNPEVRQTRAEFVDAAVKKAIADLSLDLDAAAKRVGLNVDGSKPKG